MGETTISKIIKASAKNLYQALTNPKAIEVWQVPGNMTGKVYNFNLSVGGGYTMFIFYPETEKEVKGKTSEKEDRFTARFIELTQPKKIIEAINFETSDPDFLGEMIMEITFETVNNDTKVTFLVKNIPKGIKPEDNEKGTVSSLDKLAKYVE